MFELLFLGLYFMRKRRRRKRGRCIMLSFPQYSVSHLQDQNKCDKIGQANNTKWEREIKPFFLHAAYSPSILFWGLTEAPNLLIVQMVLFIVTTVIWLVLLPSGHKVAETRLIQWPGQHVGTLPPIACGGAWTRNFRLNTSTRFPIRHHLPDGMAVMKRWFRCVFVYYHVFISSRKRKYN